LVTRHICFSCFVDMAAASAIEAITECPICHDIFTDTRVLPCIHTYCLKCITTYTRDKKEGDKIPCPECRKEFTIPEGGISKLPKNYYVEKLLNVRTIASVLGREDSLCNLCTDEGALSESMQKRDRKAVVYCVNCRKNMCKQCHGIHQQMNLTVPHKLIEHGESPIPMDDLLLKFPETSCDKHPEKSLEYYCFECKVAICMNCYIKERHGSHDCTVVKDVANDLANLMTAKNEGIKAKIKDCKSMVEKIEGEECILKDKVKEAKKVINEKADRMKQVIDEHRNKVLEKLSASESRQLKQNQNVKQGLERQMVIMESFLRYTGALKQTGTPCDIVKWADELCVRGAELENFDVEVDLPVDYTFTEVKFEATFSEDDVRSLFGDLDITAGIKGT